LWRRMGVPQEKRKLFLKAGVTWRVLRTEKIKGLKDPWGKKNRVFRRRKKTVIKRVLGGKKGRRSKKVDGVDRTVPVGCLGVYWVGERVLKGEGKPEKPRKKN